MADISDVETAMVQLAAGFLGIPAPYLAGSVVVSPVSHSQIRISRGWPVAPSLDADLKAGISNVTVFPVAGMVRNSTRYMFQWHQSSAITPTLTATISGASVTFGGTGGAGQVAGVQYGSGPSVPSYAYRLSATDTPLTVAMAFAALIPCATNNGTVLTIPTNYQVNAVVVADQSAWLETRRQTQAVWVMTWCPDPLVRDTLASTIDAGFANMQDQWGRQTEFFALPDGSDGWLKYAGSWTDDTPQQANLFRRNLRYVIEYPTTLLQQQPEVVFVGGPLWTGGVLQTWGSAEPSVAAEASPDGNSVFVDDAGNIIGAQPTS